MPLIAPVLDDRTFEQLRAELVNRIPVYNPEWTDYNRSDPAITLLELFAYLGEGLQFRFNQIPEATQLAFLKLLNIPLQPARPARALLRCSTKLAAGVALYKQDQTLAGKTPFSLLDDAQIWPLDCVSLARLPSAMPDEQLEPELFAAVQGTLDAVAQQQPNLSQIATYSTALLEADGSSAPLDCAASVDGCLWIAVLKDPAISLTPAAGKAVRLNLGFVPTAIYPDLDAISACPGDGGLRGPSLEWRASAPLLDAQGQPRYLPIRVLADSTAGFTQQGVVRLDLPTLLTELGVPPAPAGLEGSGEFPPLLDDKRAEQVWFWLRVWRSDASRIGSISLLSLNAVEVEQAVSAGAEIIGTGNSQPFQRMPLARQPVLPDPLQPVQLQVREGDTWIDWQQQADLDASTANDRHFSLDAEAGSILFGERFPQIGEAVRVLSYRYGGGSSGNVPAGAISKIDQLVSGLSPAAPMQRANDSNLKLINPLPALGGLDSERLEAALARIPGDLRRRNRCVTRDDFGELAMMTPGVELGRADCLPLFHAPSRISPRPGVVSVVIWPARDPRHPNAPVPDSYQLKQVCQWLDTKRLITTELYVIPPTYRRIAINLSVKVHPGYGLDAVRDWVELVLRQYLAPLPPFGPEGRGWPLGRRVLDRELEGVAMQVEGVDYVATLRLGVWDGSGWIASSEVNLNSWEVPEVAALLVLDEASAVPPAGLDVAPPASPTAVPIPVLRGDC